MFTLTQIISLACLIFPTSYSSMISTKKSTVAILGASGYTGAELMRLLTNHPNIDIKVLTADRSAGQEFKAIYPQFSYLSHLPRLSKWEESQAEIEKCDIAFCCLPHGTTQEIISELSKSSVKIVDLSADFRLRDIESYKTWYGKEHAAPILQKEAVYGLTELNRVNIRKARILANPGCYPTAAQLPLIPLLKVCFAFFSSVNLNYTLCFSGRLTLFSTLHLSGWPDFIRRYHHRC